jgi:2-oxoglutarate dehydrogenase E2 component (dihydrolipoamide succinyltransferase)
MAKVPIMVPSVGESISEGILARWLKPPGSLVKSGDPLFELETDKASNVVNATAEGILATSVAEGDTVAIGAVIGHLDSDGSATVPSAAPPAKPAATPVETTNVASTDGGKLASPAARRAVSEAKLDPGKIEPTGRGGVLLKEDVIAHREASEKPRSAPVSNANPNAAAPRSSADRQTRQRMTGIRQKIAQRLLEAQQNAAILTTFNEADMSRVMELRAKHKEAFQKKHGVGLGFMSFFVKATVDALQAFPAVNARIEGTEILFNHFYDIGVAVSTERGLMVPVVRDADRLSFAEVEKRISDFAKKARENTITVDDLTGGTFTITNGGVFGSLLSTPILNPPQSGILGMHAIQKRPVVVDDQVVIRPMMYLALSYDHRLVDGREAVSFLVRIKECIENPERLLLDV